jgi:hypothetical protein
VGEEHVDELVADARHGIEGAHRTLRNESDVAPADAPELGLRQADEISALEHDLTARDPAGRS